MDAHSLHCSNAQLVLPCNVARAGASLPCRQGREYSPLLHRQGWSVRNTAELAARLTVQVVLEELAQLGPVLAPHQVPHRSCRARHRQRRKTPPR